MCIDIKQFNDAILVPTLVSLGLYSKEACELIIGTGLQESGFTQIQQEGKGPALGFFQCEPETYHSILRTVFLDHASLKNIILASLGCEMMPEPNALLWNLKLAVIICRLHYHRIQAPIPTDLSGQADYYKKYYNTNLGKGTATEYIYNYQRYSSHVE